MKPTLPKLLVAVSFASLTIVPACTDDATIPGVDSDTPPPPPPAMSEAALSSPEKTAFNYFVSKGLTKAESAGIVGNLIQESNVDSDAVQYGGGPGRGIAQWSVGGRWDSSYHDNVVWYVDNHGMSRWSLTAQLDFIWFELTNWGYGYGALRDAGNNVVDATVAFEDDYEICGDCEQNQRIDYAESVLANEGGGGGGGAGCYSDTKGREMPDNACVQSKFDDLWYQCDNGDWVDRWTDPTACNGVYPL